MCVCSHVYLKPAGMQAGKQDPPPHRYHHHYHRRRHFDTHLYTELLKVDSFFMA